MGKYKGYRNKTTWTLAIWIKTDESLNNYWRHKAKTLPETELSKELKTYFEERNPLIKEFTFYSNLLTDSLKLINWDEIARTLHEMEYNQ
jgi:hypothetical protein